MSRLPNVNDLLDIIAASGAVYRSRVENAEDGRYMVAAPVGVDDSDLPALGGSLLLAWNMEGARFGVPVTWLGLTRERPARWLVEVAGEPRSQSRRRYVRGGGGERAVLHRIEEEGLAERQGLSGQIMDISESAMRFRTQQAEYQPGDEVEARFQLSEYDLAARGWVQTLRPAGVGRIDVVVDFDLREEIAQAIRRYVFQQQRAERRARLQQG